MSKIKLTVVLELDIGENPVSSFNPDVAEAFMAIALSKAFRDSDADARLGNFKVTDMDWKS